MKTASLTYVVTRLSKRFKVGSFTVSGRNSLGRICVHHRGGGLKFKYRLIDFYRRINQSGVIYNIVYDPNRTAFIGLILYENGLASNIVLSDGVSVGSHVFSGDNSNVLSNFKNAFVNGSAVPLAYCSLFQIVNNVEFRPFFGAALGRAAGSGLIIVQFSSGLVTLKSKSGWLITVSEQCLATLGFASNVLWKSKRIKKAGVVRGWGWRPVVRGVAMNPCDHPHGGGEGKKGSPRNPKTPWGKFARHTPTKNKKSHRLMRRLYKKIR